MLFRIMGGVGLLFLGISMLGTVLVPTQVTGLLLLIGAIGLLIGV